MTAKQITFSETPDKYAMLGGRCLTSVLVNDEVPAKSDALGPENKLVFAPGYFSGTSLINTSRLSVGAKSPLTGGIKENNVGGEAMADLIKKRGGRPQHKGCAQRIIDCSNEFVDPNGEYVTSSLEYETIWSMGAMIDNDNLDTIARLDFLCDDIGLDTINTIDPLGAEGQVEASRDTQIHMAAVDSVGLCDFAQSGLATDEGMANVCKMVSAKSGKPFDLKDWTEMGLRVLKAEREFNRNAGLTNEDDRLPEMFYKEPLAPHNGVVKVTPGMMDTNFDFKNCFSLEKKVENKGKAIRNVVQILGRV